MFFVIHQGSSCTANAQIPVCFCCKPEADFRRAFLCAVIFFAPGAMSAALHDMSGSLVKDCLQATVPPDTSKQVWGAHLRNAHKISSIGNFDDNSDRFHDEIMDVISRCYNPHFAIGQTNRGSDVDSTKKQ